MIRIMDNTKPLADLVNDSTNGLGCLNVLDDSIVTEELNGIYEAEFKIMVSEKHYADLSVDSIVKIPVNEAGDEQLFRVYFVSPEINGMVLVKAQHITYDLSKVAVEPFTATGAVAAKNGMLDHMMGTYPFNMTTDITNTTSNFKLSIPRSFRECLGGYEGSLLDVFRGEYEWDNLTVKMLAHRGADNSVRIAYGKNLTDFKQEMNNENVYTAVLGYAVVNEQTVYGSIYHKIVAAYPKVKIVDFSSDYSETVPTPEQLTAKAQTYAQNNSIEVPKVNITVSFVPLNQTEEYKNIAPLERVSLGDTVHVFFDKLGVEASSRVVKTVWNINAGRYDSIELGSTKANLNTVIDSSVSDAVDKAIGDIDIDTGFIEDEINELADLVINGLGLFVTKNVLIDGSERIVLHNKPTIAQSTVLYYISANGLVVSTDGGSTWNAGFNPDGSAYFNALAANIIRALQIYGSFLRFGNESTNYIDVAPYNENNVPQGISFDGTGSIRLRPQGDFLVHNTNGNGYDLNTFVVGRYESSDGQQTYTGTALEFHNYDINFHNEANVIRMRSNGNPANQVNSFTMINKVLYDGTENMGSMMYMNSSYVDANTAGGGGGISSYDVSNGYMGSRLNTSSQIVQGAKTNSAEMTAYKLNSSYAGVKVRAEVTSSAKTLTLEICNDSGGTLNDITMNNTGSMYIRCNTGDINIYASGAVRLSSSGSQDVTITASDDLHLNFSDKFYINGTRVGFRSDGSLGQI